MTAWIVGGMLAAVGILVYFFPNLIAGYNTMSREQKAKVNIGRLKKFLCAACLGMGALLCLAQLLWFSTLPEDSYVPDLAITASLSLWAVGLVVVANSRWMKTAGRA